jgi:hypothetical protein
MMKNKPTSMTLGQALYFVFVLLLLFSEPIGPIGPAGRMAYYLFAVDNLINLVRILRKPLIPVSRVNQDAR